MWHPIGFDESSNSTYPSCIEWGYKAKISYDGKKWKFDNYEKVEPNLIEVTELPKWNKNIWN